MEQLKNGTVKIVKRPIADDYKGPKQESVAVILTDKDGKKTIVKI